MLFRSPFLRGGVEDVVGVEVPNFKLPPLMADDRVGSNLEPDLLTFVEPERYLPGLYVPTGAGFVVLVYRGVRLNQHPGIPALPEEDEEGFGDPLNERQRHPVGVVPGETNQPGHIQARPETETR